MIFSATNNHADMADRLGIPRDKILSAGFFQTTSEGAMCYGRSESLEIESDPMDSQWINKLAGDNVD